MATSNLPDMIKRHEGLSLREYRCSQGKRTIGWGWNLDANPLPPDIREYLKTNGAITRDIAERLLTISIGRASADCKSLYTSFSSFSDRRQDALIDLIFNMGLTTLKTFRNTNRAINEGRWDDAAEGIRKSLYWRQLGGDPIGTDDGKLERPEEIYIMLKEG